MLEALKFKLAALFVALPSTWYSPETPPPESPAQRDTRVSMAAVQLVEAVEASPFPKSQRLVALNVAASIWQNESGLDWAVHAGVESPVGPGDWGAARCMGQIHTWPGNYLLTREQWTALVGTDEAATRRCADATLSYLWYHAERCLRVGKANRWAEPLRDDEVLRLFAAYGEGYCAPVQASNHLRLQTYRRYRAAMSKPLPKQSDIQLAKAVAP